MNFPNPHQANMLAFGSHITLKLVTKKDTTFCNCTDKTKILTIYILQFSIIN